MDEKQYEDEVAQAAYALLVARFDASWIEVLRSMDEIYSVRYGDEGVRFIEALLTCNREHTVSVDSEQGGWDEFPGIPSFKVLAWMLHSKVQRHDCLTFDRDLTRIRAGGAPF